MVSSGDRLSYNGELCTVKFIGTIPAWPNDIALGVEWDNDSNGKHDGCYKGIQYFETLKDGSGSFLKLSKKSDGFLSFYQALIQSYGAKIEEINIHIGNKKVESYGFDKLQELQSNFKTLETISLSHKLVTGILKEEEELVLTCLISLRSLDLSFNLFSNVDQIFEITQNIPKLEKLNLTGNRFCLGNLAFENHSLKSLNLASTFVSQQVFSKIIKLFPKLDCLYLSYNKIQALFADIINCHELLALDLSNNELDRLPKELSQLNLENLVLSNNNIVLADSANIFQTVKKLDLRRNKISSWSELNILKICFPNLAELRINGNPVFEGMTAEDAELRIIATFENLIGINGLNFTAEERNNAELYFLSMPSQDMSTSDLETFRRLEKKHQRNTTNLIKSEDNIESKILELNVTFNDSQNKITILKSFEMLQFKGIISRRLKIPAYKLKLSYKLGDRLELVNNELSLISSYEFTDGQTIYIDTVS